jgi:hypothetical protein
LKWESNLEEPHFYANEGPSQRNAEIIIAIWKPKFVKKPLHFTWTEFDGLPAALEKNGRDKKSFSSPSTRNQGCQMEYFKTKNLNFNKFCRVL